jgi:hypothetical protein
MSEIGLVGPGVLGRSLALSLPPESHPIGPVLSSTRISARRAVREMKRGYAVETWRELAGRKTILLAVPQSRLACVLLEACDDLPQPRGVRLLLTGLVNPDVGQAIARLERKGAHVGGLLPIALYRRPSLIPANSSFGLWGSNAALRAARELVVAVRGKYEKIDPGAAHEALLAVAMVSGTLTTSIELGVRRLVRAGFSRTRALEALAPLAGDCVAEHRHSRRHAPTRRLPTDCAELMAACERDPRDSFVCQTALRLLSEDIA